MTNNAQLAPRKIKKAGTMKKKAYIFDHASECSELHVGRVSGPWGPDATLISLSSVNFTISIIDFASALCVPVGGTSYAPCCLVGGPVAESRFVELFWIMNSGLEEAWKRSESRASEVGRVGGGCGAWVADEGLDDSETINIEISTD